MSEPEQPVQELREDARLLWALLEATVHAVVIVHESGEIVLVNAAAEVLFGYRCGELVGEEVEILAPERFRHSHREQRGRFTAEGRIRPLGIGVDLVACRKDGTEFPVEIGLSRLHTDGGC